MNSYISDLTSRADKSYSTFTGNLILKFETFDLKTIIANFGCLYSTCDNTKCKSRGAERLSAKQD